MNNLTITHLESLLKYIQDEKSLKTPANIVLAGVEGRILGIIDNLKAEGK